jgi:hypothetical protein
MHTGDAAEAVFSVPDLGGLDDIGLAVLVPLALVVLAVLVVPLLLFGIELILLGLILAAGIVGRTLLGRPWIVRATLIAGGAKDISWRVVGWRSSTRLIEEVRASLSAGLDPAPAEALELIPGGRV